MTTPRLFVKKALTSGIPPRPYDEFIFDKGNSMDIKSVAIYFATFLLSYFFLWVSDIFIQAGERNAKNRNFDVIGSQYVHYCKKRGFSISSTKLCGIFFAIIGILIPSFLAACRSIQVGTDNKPGGRYTPAFLYALKSPSFLVFYNYIERQNPMEYLFVRLMYFCAKRNSLNLFYFLVQLISLACLYTALFKLRNYLRPSLGMLIYYFIFYNFSLSGMRQSVAMPFVILGWVFLNDKRRVLSATSFLLGFLFHKSVAIIVLMLLVISFFSKLKNKLFAYSTFFATLIFAFLFYVDITSVITTVFRILHVGYVAYLAKYITAGWHWENFMMTDFLTKSLLVVIALITIYISGVKINKILGQALICILLGRYFTLCVIIFYEATRIAYYFDLFLVIVLPYTVRKCFTKNVDSQLCAESLVVLPAMAYWLYFIMYIGAYETNVFQFYSGI